MNESKDPVEAAFDALRTDTQNLDTLQPMNAVVDRRGGPRFLAAILSGATAVLLVVVGFAVLRGDDSDPTESVVVDSPEPDIADPEPADLENRDPTGEGEPAQFDSESLVGTSWTLVPGDGPDAIPVVAGWPITINFDTDTLGGTAACNDYGASYSINSDRITITEGSQTTAGCLPEVEASEAAFLAALEDISGIRMFQEQLILVGPNTELVFDPNAPIPVDGLVDKLWLLTALVEGDTTREVQGDPATLLLAADGSVTGSTGCRTLTGRYIVAGNQIVFPDFAAEGDCSSQLRDQDGRVITVLEGGFTAVVEDDLLTLTAAGNESLQYQAITPDELSAIPSNQVATDAELLAGTSWILTRGEGSAGQVGIVSGFEPTITFDDDGVLSGNLSCNDFTSNVTFDGQRLDIGSVAATKILCTELGVTDAEEAFGAALQEVADFFIETGDQLILTGEATELVFETLDPIATEPTPTPVPTESPVPTPTSSPGPDFPTWESTLVNQHFEAIGTSATLIFPKFAGALTGPLNAAIDDEIAARVREYTDLVVELGRSDLELTIKYEVTLASPKLVSVRFDELLDLGGAHPDEFSYAVNFNLELGRRIDASELIADPVAFAGLVNAEWDLLADLQSFSLTYDPLDASDPSLKQFAITPAGLEVTSRLCLFACAAKNQRFVATWADLGAIIDPTLADLTENSNPVALRILDPGGLGALRLGTPFAEVEQLTRRSMTVYGVNNIQDLHCFSAELNGVNGVSLWFLTGDGTTTQDGVLASILIQERAANISAFFNVRTDRGVDLSMTSAALSIAYPNATYEEFGFVPDTQSVAVLASNNFFLESGNVVGMAAGFLPIEGCA